MTEDERFIAATDAIIGLGGSVTVSPEDKWRSALTIAIIRRRNNLGIDTSSEYGERARIVVDKALGDE